MTMLPPDVQYGYVRGHFALAVGDTTWDEDRLPDELPAEGAFVFEPVQDRLVSLSDNDPTTILMRPITCTLKNGLLCDPTGVEGVWLVVGQYRVRAALVGASYPSGVIEVTAAHTPESPLDISLAIPMTPPGEAYVVPTWASDVAMARDSMVVDGDVVGDDLILTRHNGSSINAGAVKGDKGDKGDQGIPGAEGLPTDAAVSALVTIPSDTKTALELSMQSFRSAAGGSAGTDRIASLRDFGRGVRRVACVSDSTANDANDWFRIATRDFGLTLPAHMRREYRAWSDATQAYTVFVDNAGTVTPATGGVMMNDTFTRTVTDLVGSTSDNGKVWAGTTGKWSTDGESAVPTGGAGPVAFNVGARDATLTAQLVVVTSPPAAAVNRRFYVGSSSAILTSGVWAGFGISTTGNPSLSLWKTIGGVSTQIGATSFATGLTGGSDTPQSATLKLEVSIQNVSATLTVNGTPVTISGTITEADYAALGTFAGFVNVEALPASTANKVSSITLETPATAATFDGLVAINGAVGGVTLAYQQSRLATMFPTSEPIDVLILTTGHNYGTMTGAAFTAALESFLTDWFALHPASDVLLTSQNPQFAPAPSPAAHAERQAALRAWAAKSGYEYLPVFERFVAEPDGGVSLVGADGIHPTTPPVGDLSVWSGARLWADIAGAAIEGRTIRA